MADKEGIGKPKSGTTVGEAWAQVKERSQKFEKRLSALSKRKLVTLAAVVGAVSICTGVGLGYLINPYRPTATPGGDLSTPSNSSTPETVSQSGVLRKFKTSQDGVDYYLEKQDGSQVFLTASKLIDASLLQSFVGLVVTVEGKVAKIGENGKDVLEVEKIWIKQ